MTNQLKLFLGFAACLMCLLLPTISMAAELKVVADNQVGVGDQFLVTVMVNSTEAINALEGELMWPGTLLEAKSIRLGNSVVNFWVTEPTINHDHLIFSGVTPGGLTPQAGQLLQVVFVAKKAGQGVVALRGARVLLNNGQGQQASLITTNLNLDIKTVGQNKIVAPEQDVLPPETFTPQVGRDTNILGGNNFLAFSTVDKLSGVDHYEIKESRFWWLSWFKKWQGAESPELLVDQSLASYIYIKAIDQAGNERVVRINPQLQAKWYESFWFWSIIILAIIFFTKKKLTNDQTF